MTFGKHIHTITMIVLTQLSFFYYKWWINFNLKPLYAPFSATVLAYRHGFHNNSCTSVGLIPTRTLKIDYRGIHSDVLCNGSFWLICKLILPQWALCWGSTCQKVLLSFFALSKAACQWDKRAAIQICFVKQIHSRVFM